MLFITVLLWTLQTKLIACSLVIDKPEQDEINYNEYCPKMQNCPEGAHVMCMYYKPNTVAGPRCSGFQNVSISFDVAEKLVDLVNEIRGRVAMGVETGKDNSTLPRAYGMFKLKWDNELATFAQVLANTCTVKNDLCRATKKHPDPGQLVSLVRFSKEEWYPVLHLEEFTIQGLVPEKIEYAAREGYKSWYGQKQFATREMVNNVPDYSDPASQGRGKMYLQLVDGTATHMGCGLSAYVEYVYHGSNKNGKLVYNAVHIVCNFSSQPRKNTLAYKTEKPLPHYDAPYSKCGCPEGAEEDDRCLCSWNPSTSHSSATCANDVDCKPAVVLLPIFTVEDAPLNMLQRHGPNVNKDPYSGKTSDPKWAQNQNEITELKNGGLRTNNLDFLENQNSKSFMGDQQLQLGLDPNDEHSPYYVVNSIGAPYSTKRIPFGNSQISGLRKLNINSKLNTPYPESRYQNYDSTIPNVRSNNLNSLSYQEKRRIANPTERKTNKVTRKSNIFSNVLKSQLTATSNNYNSYPNMFKDKPIKLDVAPRDFSQVQEIVNSYLNIKHQYEPNLRLKKSQKPKSHTTDVRRYVNNKFHYEDLERNKDQAKSDDVKNLNEEFDNKLMTLLDTLEQEVKHIELGANEKEIFDAKIRHIYGTVVGKPSDSFRSQFTSLSEDKVNHLNNESDFDDNYLLDNIEDPNQKIIDKEMYETEDKVRSINSKEHGQYIAPTNLYVRPISRDQNAIASYEEQDIDHYDFRNTFSNLDEFKNKVTIKNHNNNMHNAKNFRNGELLRRPKLNRYKNVRDHHLSQAIGKYNNQRDPRLRYKNRIGGKNLQFRSRTSHKGRVIESREKSYRNQNRFYGDDKHHKTSQGDAKDRYFNTINEMKYRYEDPKREGSGYNMKKYNDYDEDNGPLSADRRKFYQEKLDNLERKLRNKHLNQLRNDHEKVRARRLMRGRVLQRTRPTQHEPTHFYMPDRARFLHGY